MRICIMGTPVRQGNRGVLALGASLINLCCEASPGGEVRLLLGNRDNEPAPFRVGGQVRLIPVVHARMSPRGRPRDHLLWILMMSLLYRAIPLARVRTTIARSTPWIKAVVEADLVGDVRGGDSFSDIYGMKEFLYGFVLVWTVLLVKRTIVQFPQTYGPYRNPLARWLARLLLKRSSVIIARDQPSRQLAQELVGPEREVLLSPDVAFSLESVRPDRIDLDPPLSGPIPSGIIGLNVNGLMFNGGYTRDNMFRLKLDYPEFLPRLVRALLSEHPGELWLVPHTFAPPNHVESDEEASKRLRDSLSPDLRKRLRLVAADYDQHELKWVIGQCSFFIGSRMHACIAALSQGVPSAGVAYSRKFAGVFESVGMGGWVVDAQTSDADQALDRVISLFRQRNDVRPDLTRQGEQARRRLTELFCGLVIQHAPPGESSSLRPQGARGVAVP